MFSFAKVKLTRLIEFNSSTLSGCGKSWLPYCWILWCGKTCVDCAFDAHSGQRCFGWCYFEVFIWESVKNLHMFGDHILKQRFPFLANWDSTVCCIPGQMKYVDIFVQRVSCCYFLREIYTLLMHYSIFPDFFIHYNFSFFHVSLKFSMCCWFGEERLTLMGRKGPLILLSMYGLSGQNELKYSCEKEKMIRESWRIYQDNRIHGS